MTPRALFVVAALAAAAIGLAVIGQRQSAPTGSPEGGPVLPGLAEELDALVRVAVVGAGGETLATLERADGGWTVAERDGYAADLARLREALLALAEARVLERKTSDPALHARIGVEDVELASAASTLVRLEEPDGASRALILGDSDRAGERYARRPGEAQSFLMDRDPSFPRDPSEWVEPGILDVAGARVQSVSIRHADGATLEIGKSVATSPCKACRKAASFAAPPARTRRAARSGASSSRTSRASSPRRPASPPRRFATRRSTGSSSTRRRIASTDWLVFSASAADTADDGVRSEAEAINARVSGWRYRIASNRYDRMTRRIEDLLAPAE